LSRRPDDAPRCRDVGGHCPSLRTRRVAAAAGESFLVSVLRRRDGHGLAFLRYHDERHRCAQARADTALGRELGIHVCGGRGSHSRRTPQELISIGDQVGIDGAALATASRLVAKVDSAAVQDGFDLYLHGFIVTDDGKWTVVQQGMNGEHKQARRYHWLSEGLTSFVDDPHAAIEGAGQGEIINLADRRAEASRLAQIDLLVSLGPDVIAHEFSSLKASGRPRAAVAIAQPLLPHLVMPTHHDVRSNDVIAQRLRGNLAAAADRGAKDFPDLLLTPGVGARTVQALAMVAEVRRAPYRFTDPARFSFAHGGKDRDTDQAWRS
jgi:hypothetical protein